MLRNQSQEGALQQELNVVKKIGTETVLYGSDPDSIVHNQPLTYFKNQSRKFPALSFSDVSFFN